MLEVVLMRAFLMLYSSDFECDDDRRRYKSGKSRSSEIRAFTVLSWVCSSWRYTLTGWPESPTRHWMRHQLKKLIEREYKTDSDSKDHFSSRTRSAVYIG